MPRASAKTALQSIPHYQSRKGRAMRDNEVQSLMARISARRTSLTPRARILADYVLQNSRRVIFMTIKQLASACQVSESSVVRFVAQMGYEGYPDFIQSLRNVVDTGLTLLDRVELADPHKPESERLRRTITEEVENLKRLYETIDVDLMRKAVDLLDAAREIYVIGSRLSYTMAYYMGWGLTKIRPGIRILKGSDSTCVDWLTIAPSDILVVIFATSRYPNELIKVAKLLSRLRFKCVVICDSPLCPLIQFARLSLVAPARNIPIYGSPTSLMVLITCLINELVSRDGSRLRSHQERLEQAYLENDILFDYVKRLDGTTASTAEGT
jgi:DNA-binding MurR/RpiR family transcriptional regulator